MKRSRYPWTGDSTLPTRRRTDDVPRGLSTDLEARGLSSAFLQLVYPWLTTELSHRLPGALVPPDAVLAGVVARSALEEMT